MGSSPIGVVRSNSAHFHELIYILISLCDAFRTEDFKNKALFAPIHVIFHDLLLKKRSNPNGLPRLGNQL